MWKIHLYLTMGPLMVLNPLPILLGCLASTISALPDSASASSEITGGVTRLSNLALHV